MMNNNIIYFYLKGYGKNILQLKPGLSQQKEQSFKLHDLFQVPLIQENVTGWQ